MLHFINTPTYLLWQRSPERINLNSHGWSDGTPVPERNPWLARERMPTPKGLNSRPCRCSTPSGCVSRMDVLLSRNINGAVDVGNTDLILPLRVRARRENAVKTPGFGSGERSQCVPAMGRSEEAGQRCSEGERFGLKDVRASALTAKHVSQPPLRFTGRLYAVILPGYPLGEARSHWGTKAKHSDR